eukprot:951288-Pyramimonas_sp.AAC.1
MVENNAVQFWTAGSRNAAASPMTFHHSDFGSQQALRSLVPSAPAGVFLRAHNPRVSILSPGSRRASYACDFRYAGG